jgi:hypothetical protein
LTLQNYGVAKDCSEFAQNYFVTKRKQEQEWVSSQEASGVSEEELEYFNKNRTDQHTFLHWLLIGKLNTISKG